MPLPLDKHCFSNYNIGVYRGMAKFGIALGSGPRGRGFESRYSDQKSGDHIRGRRFLYRENSTPILRVLL